MRVKCLLFASKLTVFALLAQTVFGACAPAPATPQPATPVPLHKPDIAVATQILDIWKPGFVHLETVPRKDVLLVNPETSRQLKSYTAEGTLTYSQITPQLELLKVGQVLVSEPTIAASEGFLRRVVDVRQIGNNYVLETAQATLVEAVEQGSLQVERPITADDVVAQAGKPGEMLLVAAPAEAGGKLVIELRKGMYFSDDKDSQANATARIELEPKLQFDLEIQGSQVTQLYFRSVITQTVSIQVEAHQNFARGEMAFLQQDIPLKPFVVYLPGSSFPIVITPMLSLSVGLSGDLTGGVQTGFEQEGVYVAGAVYNEKEGWDYIWVPPDFKEPKFTPPSLDLGCRAKLQAGPELKLKLFGVVGPFAGLYSYIRLTLAPPDDPMPVLKVGLEYAIGVKIEIFGGVLTKFAYEDSISEQDIKVLALSPPPPPASSPPQATSPPGSRTLPQDGMVLIFIPAGEFTMGTQISGTPDDTFDEFAHQVYLHSFYIDQTEVTNAMFTLFVEATGYQTTAEQEGKSWVRERNWVFYQQVEGADWRHPFGPESNLEGLDFHPVVHMSWDDAQAYCEWAGRRLPTEAEWEKAARGEQSFIYPWGNQDPAGHLANLADRGSVSSRPGGGFYQVDYDDGYALTAPVGSFPAGASPYGALDMAGNALEWVADNYGPKFYQKSPFENPLYTGFSLGKVQRGGSWDSGTDGARSAYRGSSSSRGSSNENGFRCAMEP